MIKATLQSKPASAAVAKMPSPSCWATAIPLGPPAPISHLTSIGRCGVMSGECSIWICAPSHVTASPRSRPWSVRTYSATKVHGSARLPIAIRPVNPDPTATVTRSVPASSTSVAIAAALVIGWRLLGTRTPGPSPMRSVRSAARQSCTQTSGYSGGES